MSAKARAPGSGVAVASVGAALLLSVAVAAIGLRGRSGPERIDVPDQATWWTGNGFVEMVPAIALPSTPDGRDRIEVWLKVPEGGQIHARWLPGQGRPTLRYPEGTVADRVERAAYGKSEAGEPLWSVIDVRGTRLGPGALEWFHVYRPVAAAPGGPLFGYEWRRDAPEAGHAAVARFSEQMPMMTFDLDHGDPLPEGARTRRMDLFRRRNDCATCHQHDKPQVRGRDEAIAIARPTDEAGFYGVLSALADEVPLEAHRTREMNVGAPFVEIRCGSAPPSLEERPDGARRYVCADGTIPLGRMDVARALAAGDSRAKRVCWSRQYLFERMAEDARQAFAPAFQACGLLPRG